MFQPILNKAQASLAGLTSAELSELLNDDEKLEERVNAAVCKEYLLIVKSLKCLCFFFINYSKMTQLEEEKQNILDGNSKIAEESLTKEPELAEQKQRLIELSTQGKELCSKVQELLNQSSKAFFVMF